MKDLPLPLKKAKRKGIFCVSQEEKIEIQKNKLEKTLTRKKQKQEVFNYMHKKQNEIQSKIESKLKEIKKQITEEQDKMITEKQRLETKSST